MEKYCRAGQVKGKAVPLQAWSGPEGSRKLRFPDFMTTAQDGGKVVSLMHRPPLPPGNTPGTHFCQRLSRPQGHSAIGRILCQWKIPMTPSGIEPATFRFIAQHLNHWAGQVTDDNMAHGHCMLDKKGYRHALPIRNTYCFHTQQWLHESASIL